MKGWEERTNREAASRYLITRALCKIRRVSKINIRLELMFATSRRGKREEFFDQLRRYFASRIIPDILLQLKREFE